MIPTRACLPNRRPSHVETLEVGGRAVVTSEGPGQPIMLKVYGVDGEVAVRLLPKRALTLAQELLTRGVQAIKADTWEDMYGQAAPQRAPDLGRCSL